MKLQSNVLILIVIWYVVSQSTFAQQYNSDSINHSNNDSIKSKSEIAVREVLLNSFPQDVYVFFKDSLVGNTPLFVHSSYGTLTLKKPGYDDLVISFNEIIPGKIPSMHYTGEEKERSFFERDIFKILTAGILVLGGTSAYFKLKADDKFEQYEFSGDGKLLDETRKYDLISGISFTALQINFGLLLYFFLVE
jgi:hypothetical protein